MQKSRPHLASILNEKYNYFLQYLAFFEAKTSPKLNEGGVKGQVSTTFLEAPPSGLACCKRISVVAFGKLELFQLQCCFCGFQTCFFDFGLVFGCHAPKMENKQLDIRMLHFILNLLKNFFSKISTPKKAHPTSKIINMHFLAAEWKSLFRYIPGCFLLIVGCFIGHFRSFLARCRSLQVVSDCFLLVLGRFRLFCILVSTI